MLIVQLIILITH